MAGGDFIGGKGKVAIIISVSSVITYDDMIFRISELYYNIVAI